jgi:hypothetical protein
MLPETTAEERIPELQFESCQAKRDGSRRVLSRRVSSLILDAVKAHFGETKLDPTPKLLAQLRSLL